MNRRKFLKKSLYSANVLSVLSLTGCAALDRYFEIEKSDYSKEVLIFGGGISGLCTAYFLKKNGVPYRVFEGSQRLGGRIQSQRLPSPINSIDLGARYVDSLDQSVVELIKEMNLDLEEAPIQKNAYHFISGKDDVSFKSLLASHAVAVKSWNKELIRMRKFSDELTEDPSNESALNEIVSYDRISFSDILNDSKMDVKSKAIFKNWAEIYSQKKISEISYLEWLYLWEKISISGKKMYLPNGMTQFADILGQRVMGVIPNYNMQVESKLVEIQRVKDRWLCLIQTKDGLRKLSSPYVVLALPFNQLKTIKGIENVFTNKNFREAISQAQFKSHYRVVFKSSQKSNKENGQYYFFETNRFQVLKEENVYTVDTDRPFDHGEIGLLKAQMSNAFGIKEFEELNFYSWSQTPMVNGSELKLLPKTLLGIKSTYLEGWDRMTLQLAGDYLLSPERPSLNDCVKTAQSAARNLTAMVVENDLG